MSCVRDERERGRDLFIRNHNKRNRTPYTVRASSLLSPCAHIPRVLLAKLNNREGDLYLLAEAGQTTDRPPAKRERESTRLYKDAEEAGGDAMSIDCTATKLRIFL